MSFFQCFHSIVDKNLENNGSSFAIDASYELALAVDQKIEHLPLKFCLKLSPDCIVHPLSERSECVSNIFNLLKFLIIINFFILSKTRYGKVTKDSIYFAVKTCSKFHEDRVPVLQSTCDRDAVHFEYFSDKLGNLYNIII